MTTSGDASGRQPWLHDLDLVVDGPVTVVCSPGGDIGAPGTGVYADDRRVVSTLLLTFDDLAPTPIAGAALGATADHWLAVRHLGDHVLPDATVDVQRTRRLTGRTIVETIAVTSRSAGPVRTRMRLTLAGDGAEVGAVKGGRPGPSPLPVTASPWGWGDERHRTVVAAEPAPDLVAIDGPLELGWDLDLRQGAPATIVVTTTAEPVVATGFDAEPGADGADWDPDALAAGVADPRLAELVRVGLTDLRHLLLRDPLAPDDLVAAAGTPWYLTLFGRDALWTARFMLPYSLRLAVGTLRALARRQATTTDGEIASEPGKILHEVRRTDARGAQALPPLYFGTVDATPLWVVLLGELHATGRAPEVVTELRPHLDAALDWMAASLARPEGLLRYVDDSSHGLANQGWKDSGDSMRRADGTLAPAPIALLEAQAYAVQAADTAATLLADDDPAAAASWRGRGDELRALVRQRFWVGGDDPYLAMALDGEGRPVDGVGSNMGHALGTGLLDDEESARVVERLLRPDLLRRYGIGTLSSANPGYNPVGYHTGSVWAHDTAIAIAGMAASGHDEAARRVAERLLDLGADSGSRLPELCAGQPVGRFPVPYPAACRPQAWAAASVAVLLGVLGKG